jgi:hypothetical protein
MHIMRVFRLGSYNIKTIIVLVAIVLLLAFAVAKLTGISFFSKDGNKNAAVAKPDEMYIAKDGILTRISNESRWFERFWLLANTSVEADTGSNVPANLPAIDVSTTGFLRGKDVRFTPSILGFKRLKSDSSKEFSKDRRFVLLLYNEPVKVVIPKDKTAESHQAEIALLGYPINVKGVHWVRYMLFEVDSIPQDYNLYVEGTSPYWDPGRNISYVGAGYHRQFVDKSKFDLDKELESAIDSYGRWWPW